MVIFDPPPENVKKQRFENERVFSKKVKKRPPNSPPSKKN
jgi:hypothetical protein